MATDISTKEQMHKNLHRTLLDFFNRRMAIETAEKGTGMAPKQTRTICTQTEDMGDVGKTPTKV